MTDIAPRWLSLAQAARYASMCTKTLRRYLETGDIYGSRRGGKWFVDRESIDRFFLADPGEDVAEQFFARMK